MQAAAQQRPGSRGRAAHGARDSSGASCIIGVDRLDYSKGLVDRFHAYDRFLERYPENQNRVTFLQIAPLESRADVRAYAQIRTELEQAAGRTNGKFADTDWTPIRYLNRNFPHDVLMGFMRNAQVGLVTPLRDGMNLVAKEFVAAQDPDDPGVLVLSTLAGRRARARRRAAGESEGHRVAWRVRSSRPCRCRCPSAGSAMQMLEVLRRNDIEAWHTRFIATLLDSAASRNPALARAS